MNIVVTGGAGFIGSHLVDKLAEQGHNILIIDNLSTGRIENIDKALKTGRVSSTQHSIMDLSQLQVLFKDIDYVYHLAALARVPRSINDPLTVNAVNITGTLNVLIAARDNKVKKVIFASSSSVYGNTTTIPQKEDSLANPISPYAITKLTGEQYCNVFSTIYRLPTVCLRYFCVYGPRQDNQSLYTTVIPSFIERIKQGLSPIIFGDGKQSRDFTFIYDIVKGTILAMNDGIEGIYNIGSGENTTINQLADIILNLTQKDMKPIYQDTRLGDTKKTMADISKAKGFGYKPEYNLRRGLKIILKGKCYRDRHLPEILHVD